MRRECFWYKRPGVKCPVGTVKDLTRLVGAKWPEQTDRYTRNCSNCCYKRQSSMCSDQIMQRMGRCGFHRPSLPVNLHGKKFRRANRFDSLS